MSTDLQTPPTRAPHAPNARRWTRIPVVVLAVVVALLVAGSVVASFGNATCEGLWSRFDAAQMTSSPGDDIEALDAFDARCSN